VILRKLGMANKKAMEKMEKVMVKITIFNSLIISLISKIKLIICTLLDNKRNIKEFQHNIPKLNHESNLDNP
jgi:hypothetical protein